MKLFGSLLFFGVSAGLFSQTPPAQPASPTQPTITLAVDDPGPKGIPAVPPDRTVITVGEVKITAAQFDQMIDALPENYRAVARGAGRKQFADNLVRILVLAQEGKRRKIDETATYKSQLIFADGSILAGLTADDVKKSVTLEEAELRKYYDAHKSEYEKVHVRHILVRMQGSPLPVKPGQQDLTEEQALSKAQELRRKIQNGADFAALASVESDDPNSAVRGGDLNFIHRGQRVPSFEEAAFGLTVGEISQPVKSTFGYDLIRLEAKESKSFEELRPEIEKKLRAEQAQATIEQLAAKSGAVLDPDFFGIAKK